MTKSPPRPLLEPSTPQDQERLDAAASNVADVARYPDVVIDAMTIEAISDEESALRRLSPARTRWRSVAEYDKRVTELDGQAQRLLGKLQAERELLVSAKQRDRERLADWVERGSKGGTPEPEVTRREERIEELQRRLEGVHHQVSRVLREKADHVERHHKRFAKDAAKATAAAERRYAELIDQAERARQEAVALRESELWAMCYPEVRQAELEILPRVAGDLKQPLRKAGLSHGLEPSRVFDLLRADAAWIPGAAKDELKPKLGEAERDRAFWSDTPEGQANRQQQDRENAERIERARTRGVLRAEWEEQ